MAIPAFGASRAGEPPPPAIGHFLEPDPEDASARVRSGGIPPVTAPSNDHAASSRAESSPADETASSARETSAARPEAKVLALVDGREITDRDVMRELWSERGRETFDWMVGHALLESELARLGLAIGDAEVDARLREHMNGLRRIFPGAKRDDDLARAASGMGLAEYRKRAVWAELALRMIMRATVRPDEQTLRAYYAERQAEYIEPDQALVAQIFIAPAPQSVEGEVDAPGPGEWVAAERRIIEAHNRLRMGEDFRAVASAYGSGGSTPHWIGHGELMRELEEAAFSLRVGAMSGPIRTAMGYHIILVQDRKERRAPPFEEMRERIAREYEEGLFVAAAGEFMTRLRDRAVGDGRLVVLDGEPAFPDDDHTQKNTAVATVKPAPSARLSGPDAPTPPGP